MTGEIKYMIDPHIDASMSLAVDSAKQKVEMEEKKKKDFIKKQSIHILTISWHEKRNNQINRWDSKCNADWSIKTNGKK